MQYIHESLLSKYEKEGWHKGDHPNSKLFKNHIWMTNGTQDIHVNKELENQYIDLGYRRGIRYWSDKLYVNDGKCEFAICKSEWDNYRRSGFKKAR